ncbi:response regulator, partial [Verrucomicrobiota bacterium]
MKKNFSMSKSLAGKALFFAALMLIAVILTKGFVTYRHVKSLLKEQTLEQLGQYISERSVIEKRLFVLMEDLNIAMRKEFLARLQRLGDEDPQEWFDQWMVKMDDGTYRMKEEAWTGISHQGVITERGLGAFIPPGAPIEPRHRRYLKAGYETLSKWSSALDVRLTDYFIFADNGQLVSFFPSINWSKDVEAAFDVVNSQWWWSQDMKHNPARGNAWTSPIMEVGAHELVVTGQVPIDIDGKHVGVMGGDIMLTDLRKRTINTAFAGGYNLVITKQGNLLIHPDKMEEINAKDGQFLIDEDGDPALKRIFSLVSRSNRDSHVLEDTEGGFFLAFSTIEGPDLYLITVYHEAIFNSQALSASQAALTTEVTALIIILIILWGIMKWGIRIPLTVLTEMTDNFALCFNSSEDRHKEFELEISKLDKLREHKNEIGYLANAFSKMGNELICSHKELCEEINSRTKAEVRTAELRQKTIFIQTVLENIKDGIVACDEKGTLTMFNRATKEMHGIKHRELPPEQWAEHYHLYLADGQTLMKTEDVPLYRAFQGEHVENVEMVIATKNDKSHTVLASGQPLTDEDGTKIGAMVSLHDITEQKHTEQQLLAAKEQAEEANHVKSIFLANMSHEIRTPMNAVLGFSELLQQTELNEKQASYIKTLRTAGKTLLTLINNILDLTKIEAGEHKPSYSPVSIKALSDEIKAVFEQRAKTQGLEFGIEIGEDVPNTLILDALKIRQILINLVSNALKFTQQGYVNVTINSTAVDSDSFSQVTLYIDVQDSGRGIPRELQDKIFDSFVQAQKSKENLGGTGLGLAICRRLVEMMNGTITVEGDVGRGSTFKICLHDVEIAAGQVTQQSKPKKIDFEAAKILIADDIDYNQEILTAFLEDHPFTFVYAENGEEAVSQARKHRPDLILLDMKMPVMDGYEASEKLKADEELKDIPIIAITASALKQDEDYILTVCDGYLRKPVDKIDLIHEVHRFLPKGRMAEKVTATEPKEENVGSSVSDPSATAADTEPFSLQDIQNAHILLVEDNEINQELAIALLENVVASISIAGNGQEAVDKVKQHDFDLVLMDLQMPVMDGLAATRAIRKLDKPNINALPILAMSAGDWDHDKPECLSAGINDHINKPIQSEHLYSVMSKWLKHYAEQVATAPKAEPQPQAEQDMLTIPGVNVDAALQRIGGNKKLYLKLINKFHDHHRDAVAQIQENLSAGKREDAVRIAHTVKGLAGTMGAEDLQGKSAELESILGQEDQDPGEALNTFGETLITVLDALIGFLGQTQNNSEQQPQLVASQKETDFLKTQLDELKEPLRQSRPIP